MSGGPRVAVIVGSLRRESLSRKTAEALAALTPGATFSVVEIGALQFFNEDVEAAGGTREWTQFRDQVRAADAVLFVTPEYNRSVPGALKNAIDVGSRPYGQSVFAGKPAGVISVSPGVLGAFGANHHLRQTLVFLDMATLAQPEAYIGGAAKLFDKDTGALVAEDTKTFLAKFGARFTQWIELHRRKEKLAA